MVKGKLLELGVTDSCFRIFSKNCNIHHPEKVPVAKNFSNHPEDVIGFANIIEVENGLNCEITFVNEEVKNKLKEIGMIYIGGRYDKVESRIADWKTIIDSARLNCIGVFYEGMASNKNLRLYL